jgi:hypothetical protein
MAIILDGTSGITTPDLDSTGPITGTTGTFSGALQASGVTTNIYPIVSGTAVASTSGTSIDFTGIPSWVKRITVMFSGVSTNGTSVPIIQLGDSGGFETSSYLGTAARSGTQTGGANNTSGFFVEDAGAATAVRHGSIFISLLNSSTNTWSASGVIGRSDSANAYIQGGAKSLSDPLTQVRITTVNGTDAFDAGTINILYE